MTDEEIFDLADQHGWLDDFGRWNLKDDGLISFALALLNAEREACAKVCEADANARGKTDTALVLLRAASRIRARGDVHASDMSEKHVQISDKHRHEWVGLTADDVWEVYKKHDSLQYMDFARAIETKLKELNA